LSVQYLMKFIILFFLFFSSASIACSQKELSLSNQRYSQAKNETNISKQILLLKEANQYCYAPELEMSIWMLKAESTTLDREKINYYKKAIGMLDNFGDKNESRAYLDKFYCKLAKLYKPIDKEVAYYYAKQVNGGCSKNKLHKSFIYAISIIFLALLLWVILTL